jgi:hypothetical protein
MQLADWLGSSSAPRLGNNLIISQPNPMRGPRNHPAQLQSANRPAVLQKDAEVTRLFATGGHDAGVPVFFQSPVSALSSLLDKTRREANFDPTVMVIPDNQDKPPSAADNPIVHNYFAKLQSCPLLGTQWASDFFPTDALGSGGILPEDVIDATVFTPIYQREQSIPAAWNDVRSYLKGIVNKVMATGQSVYLNPIYASVMVE